MTKYETNQKREEAKKQGLTGPNMDNIEDLLNENKEQSKGSNQQQS